MEGAHATQSSVSMTKRKGKRSGTTPSPAAKKKLLKGNIPPQSRGGEAPGTSRRSLGGKASLSAGEKSSVTRVPQSPAARRSAQNASKASAASSTSPSSFGSVEKKRPSTWEMIRNALLASRARKGVSRPALTKFIHEQYNITIDSRFNATLRRILRSNLEKGELMQVAHSYKLTARPGQTPAKSSPAPSGPKRRAQSKTSTPISLQKQTDAASGATGRHERSKGVSKQDTAGHARTRSTPSTESSFVPKKRPLTERGDISPMVSSLLKRHKKASATPTAGVAAFSPKKLSSAPKVETKTDAPTTSAKKMLSPRRAISYGQLNPSRKQQAPRASTPLTRRGPYEFSATASLSVPSKTGMKAARSPVAQKAADSSTASSRGSSSAHKLKSFQPGSPALSSVSTPPRNTKAGLPVSSKSSNAATRRPTRLSK